MSGLLDKVLLAGLGLEHKVMEKLDELAEEGKKVQEEGLNIGQEVENRLVEEIVKVVGAALRRVGMAKKEVDAVVASLAEDLADRLKIVTVDDLDVVEKLVLGAREDIKKLEKRVRELEKRTAGPEREGGKPGEGKSR